MPGRRPLVLCIGIELGRSEHQTLLERHGYQVMAVTSGREAFSMVRKNPVDAIILYPDVPGMSDGSVVRRMKDIKPHIPLLQLVRPFARIPPGTLPAADAVVLNNDAPARLVPVLDHLLDVRFPFFARWFGNWKHRDSA
jgi:CheY-like chemotaxis protein